MAARTRQKFMPFKKGDKIWLEAWNLKHSVANQKFTPKQEGPFVITKVLSPITYQLCLPRTWKIHPVFHATLLSPYCENNVRDLNFPAPPPGYCCYVNHNNNNWYFRANLSSGVPQVWDGDSAHIGDMWKSSSLAAMVKGMGSSYQPQAASEQRLTPVNYRGIMAESHPERRTVAQSCSVKQEGIQKQRASKQEKIDWHIYWLDQG